MVGGEGAGGRRGGGHLAHDERRRRKYMTPRKEHKVHLVLVMISLLSDGEHGYNVCMCGSTG